MVERRLVREGHEVVTAVDGLDAVAAIREHRPDLVVLDWMMPRMNGLEVTQQVRADDSVSGVRILILTARSQEEDVARALAAGADDYLVKPFSSVELNARVSTLLARR